MNIAISKEFSYRKEEFGGLFYNFNTRQLLLAKSKITVKLMDKVASGQWSKDEIVEDQALDDFTPQSIQAALDQLIEKGILTYDNDVPLVFEASEEKI
ncbi:MAG: mycofactocin biosynthesis chaperone MftB [Actinomycetota bacterium]|nr:mycofactocin biosynthesis chaperone MftB [Actinomycetota bacterium]